MALWRVACGEDVRLAAGAVDTGPQELLPAGLTIGGLLAAAPSPTPRSAGCPPRRSHNHGPRWLRPTARRSGRPA